LDLAYVCSSLVEDKDGNKKVLGGEMSGQVLIDRNGNPNALIHSFIGNFGEHWEIKDNILKFMDGNHISWN
jgi:hypothetical protein